MRLSRIGGKEPLEGRPSTVGPTRTSGIRFVSLGTATASRGCHAWYLSLPVSTVSRIADALAGITPTNDPSASWRDHAVCPQPDSHLRHRRCAGLTTNRPRLETVACSVEPSVGNRARVSAQASTWQSSHPRVPRSTMRNGWSAEMVTFSSYTMRPDAMTTSATWIRRLRDGDVAFLVRDRRHRAVIEHVAPRTGCPASFRNPLALVVEYSRRANSTVITMIST